MEEQMTDPRATEDSPVKQYLQEIRKVPPLTEEEKASLPQLAARGDAEAIGRITEVHLALVYDIAKRYPVGEGQMLDLLGEGNAALLRAAQSFPWDASPDIGTFRNSVHHKIRNAVLREYQEIRSRARPPMVSVPMVNALYRLQKELGRQPTVEELSKATGISVQEIRERIEASRKWEAPEEPVVEAPLPPKTREELLARLDTLAERERDILKYRFAMEDGSTHTLEEAAARFGITRERVRMIENKAIRKLRGPSGHRRSSRIFLDDPATPGKDAPQTEKTTGETGE